MDVLIKNDTKLIEGANIGKLKPGVIVDLVKKDIKNFSSHWHTVLWKVFSIRPMWGSKNKFDTNTKYCHYDEAHNDYIYL